MKPSEYRQAVDSFIPNSGMEGRIYQKIMRRSRVKRSLIFAGSTAAVLIAAILIVPQLLSTPGQEPPAETSAQVAAVPSPTLQITAKTVTGDGAMDAMDEWVPTGGQVNLSGGVSQAIADPANADALFYVAISVYTDPEQYFVYGGKTMAAWYDDRLTDPAFVHHEAVYDTWYNDVYLPYDAEMRAAEARGEEYAQGWEKHDPDALFDEYWEETQPGDVKASYALMCENLREAHDAYSEWLDSDVYGDMMAQRMADEISRLVSLGLDVEAVSSGTVGRMTGYLTKNQIEYFPVSSEYGYIIMWADKNDAIDE